MSDDIMSNDLQNDLVAYALGVLDSPGCAAVERAAAASPAVAAELRELTEAAALMAVSVANVTPPAALRGRIVAEAARARPAVSSAPVALRTSSPRPLMTVFPWLLAAAAIGGVMVTRSGLQEERDARRAAEQLATGLRNDVASLDSLVATLTASDMSTVTLSSTGAPPSARLYLDKTHGEVVLAAFRLPHAPTGRTYQLWGIAAGKAPVSLGTFDSAGEGRDVARFRLPPGLQLAVSAVTEEPAGGSPQPTSTPFLAGTLRVSE